MVRDGKLKGKIIPESNNAYRTATATRPQLGCPLAIDLDGDGIETVGIATNPVLFDGNADGIRTGTGWLRPDDAWLVLDRNGNGLIDSGRELFGVDTVLSGTPGVDAVYASTGFQALRTLDTGSGVAGSTGHGDNVFHASDAAFSQVRLWRDLNQDGVSQAGELFTLAQQNITSISLNPSANTVNLGNGNVVNGTAVVTRSNGGTSQAGTGGGDTTAVDLNLTRNPFYRQFTSPVTVTAAAKALPEMGGSGWVRDLREAMSLGTPQAAALAAKVQQFQSATTRDAQVALLDDMLRLWAETNPVQAVAPANDPRRRFVLAGDAATSARLQAAIPLLEVFNGMVVNDAGMQAPTVSTGSDGLPVSTYDMFANQAPIMLAAYDALRESVYSALVVQTRLKPYLDAINLVIDANGVRFDTAPLGTLLSTTRASDTGRGVIDLVELIRYAGPTLQATGFEATPLLRTWIDALPANDPLRPALSALDVLWGAASSGSTRADIYLGDAGNNSVSGGEGNDVLDGGAGADALSGGLGNDSLLGGDGNDSLTGEDGNDNLIGGAGADTLRGGNGEDSLDGGTGNDTLNDNAGSNTFLFGRGDGQDTVRTDLNLTQATARLNTLSFKTAVLPADVRAARVGDELLLSIIGTSDSVLVEGFFFQDNPAGNARNPLKQVTFSDGTAWNVDTITARVLAGTDGDDTIRGTLVANTLTGGLGNDTLNGAGGDDTVLGGAGNDALYSDSGNDTLDGGDGDDTLTSNLVGNFLTIMSGGRGNDSMTGYASSDRYLFNLGDGRDTIYDYGDPYLGSGTDVIRFGAGITPGDLSVTRVAGPTRLGTDLLIRHFNGTDQITVLGWFSGVGGVLHVERMEFADGTVWTSEQVSTRALAAVNTGTAGGDVLSGIDNYVDTLLGFGGNDRLLAVGEGDTLDGGDGDDSLSVAVGSALTLIGGRGNDVIQGSAGSDTYVVNVSTDVVTELANEGTDTVQSAVTWTLGTTTENLTLTGTSVIDGTGNSLNNLLVGNSANNVLTGNAGNDTLDGAAGADTLIGGAGNDIYQFGRGYGADLVRENDATVGHTDQLQFLSGVARDQVWFRRVGNKLQVSIIGGSDAATVENWYLGTQYRVEQFRTATGNALMESQVQNLVNAMAAFAPPAPGQTTLPTNYMTALQPVLAANWT